MSGGVRVDQLHCPTCGEPYALPLRLEEEDDIEIQVDQIATSIKQPGPRFIRCHRGHKWTVTTLWRRDGQPDRVQLGSYLGGGIL